MYIIDKFHPFGFVFNLAIVYKMGEKWFQFVKRIKAEGNYASLSEAMKAASKRKSEWRKDGPTPAGATSKSSGKKTKKARKSRKSKKSRKSRKSKKC